jgi:hypothetical protein
MTTEQRYTPRGRRPYVEATIHLLGCTRTGILLKEEVGEGKAAAAEIFDEGDTEFRDRANIHADLAGLYAALTTSELNALSRVMCAAYLRGQATS